MPVPDQQLAAHIAIRNQYRIKPREPSFSHITMRALAAERRIPCKPFSVADGMYRARLLMSRIVE
jgi:hypothetical protein